MFRFSKGQFCRQSGHLNSAEVGGVLAACYVSLDIKLLINQHLHQYIGRFFSRQHTLLNFYFTVTPSAYTSQSETNENKIHAQL